jgi:drug/metabolite transporter (DMT)-like permease
MNIKICLGFFYFLNIAKNPQFCTMNNQNQPLKIWAGLITLYLIWGSTYLGIRFVVESVPPFMASGLRNFLAGSILLLFAVVTKKFQRPSRKMLIATALSGFFMLTVGNGLTTSAARWIPSSYSSLFAALSPIILVLMLWNLTKEKPSTKVIIGSILGLVGVCVLMSLKSLAIKGTEQYYLLGILFLFLAILGWDIGVILIKKAEINQYNALQIAGTQMFVGGCLSLIFSYLYGEADNFQVENITTKAILSFLYLLTFGSIVGFLVFGWLSKVASPTLVATYTYVNPLVAMIVGSIFADERLHPLMLLAGGIIITAVVLITSANMKKDVLTNQSESGF